MTSQSPHGHPFAEPMPTAPTAGWYVDLSGSGGLRWWDGAHWGLVGPGASSATLTSPAARHLGAACEGEKSSAAAVTLTILWPGAGHRYLGLRKGTGAAVANGFGLLCWVSGFLWFIGLSIWLVTLCMTIGSIGRDARLVKQAARERQPRQAYRPPLDI